MEKILVLDFGGQTCQLIARRIREIGVYSEVVPGDTPVESLPLEGVKGIILSGSPYSVYDAEAPKVDPRVSSLGIPILGICYGVQQLAHLFGGKVAPLDHREYGRSRLFFTEASPLFEGVPEGFVSWMSHGDTIVEVPEGFRVIARSEHNLVAGITHERLPLYGIQFHPEVTHCEYGLTVLENFAVRICGARKTWTMASYLEDVQGLLRTQVGDDPLLLLISGGVDSTVVAALLLKTFPPEQVHLLYIDTGLMRKNETEEVEANLRTLGASNLYIVHAEERFLSALKGVVDPEKKRQIIGDVFIQVQEEELRRRRIPDQAFLAQGTLYTDLIESGKGVGNKAKVIKSHHNVRSPLIERKRKEGRVIEPLSMLYKDEVRRLGAHLGVPREVLERHPFPGPGLAVRILGEVTREKCDILREADAIFIDELKRRHLYQEIWQAFCVLLPVRTVGVTGDDRNYGYVVALRAVTSKDGMTADAYPFPTADLLEIAALITNRVKDVGRVVYDVSSKPPATIEWE
ncbi:glutamine-hydrolyzing GMP synthase [Spirochaeta thermophila]|uniref:GMP synthase [glutamine-hydrolyzing] n=1 Tax=Winmispira thermophila (strain ATCC 49972 / DSM 6192 / RI 19.B1) TaxID=665571 RepID=E0RSG2_WINT6|nr:glutamine-hydrolyzing GMP synthase [Spirochaeta thermophila]ADN01949.1 GMP synthase [Spirochaeta thermophila DSM 6192]